MYEAHVSHSKGHGARWLFKISRVRFLALTSQWIRRTPVIQEVLGSIPTIDITQTRASRNMPVTSWRRVQGLGFRVQGSGFKIRVQGSGFRAEGSGFRVLGSEFWV